MEFSSPLHQFAGDAFGVEQRLALGSALFQQGGQPPSPRSIRLPLPLAPR
jgi:hypothetical protein